MENIGTVLKDYDASKLIGLNVRLLNIAQTYEDDGEPCLVIPDLRKVSRTAALSRCLIPLSLEGWELKNIRKIMGLGAAELAERMEVAPETLSRWENGKQDMGGFVEKVFRMIVCEALKHDCPGIDYDSATIPNMRLLSRKRLEEEKGGKIDSPMMAFEPVMVKLQGQNKKITAICRVEPSVPHAA